MGNNTEGLQAGISEPAGYLQQDDGTEDDRTVLNHHVRPIPMEDQALHHSELR